MDDNSNGSPTVVELGADSLVRVPGLPEPIPASQLMSKAELTRSTQAYAQREREMREQYAEAAQLLTELQEDPVAFNERLTAHLESTGMSPRQARMAANEAIESAQGGPQMTMDDSGQWQVQQLAQQNQQLAQQLEGLQRLFFEREANTTISAEIAAARAQEAEIARALGVEGKDLTEAEMREILAVANRDGLKNIGTAYKVWKHDQLVTTAKGLREEVEVTKRKVEMPWLGGPTETGIAAPATKMSLKEIYEAKLRAASR